MTFQGRTYGSVEMEVDILGQVPRIPDEWICRDASGGAAIPDAHHVTLKYGLIPGLVSEADVWETLSGWDRPLLCSGGMEIAAFGGSDDETYVALRCPLPALSEAHRLLSRLPHVDPFPTYEPHVTLAHVPSGAYPFVRCLFPFDAVRSWRLTFGEITVSNLTSDDA